MTNQYTFSNHFQVDDPNLYLQRISRNCQLVKAYKEELKILLKTKYDQLIENDKSELFDEKMDHIKSFSQKLIDRYQNSSRLRNKLADIEEDLMWALENKLTLKESYQSSYIENTKQYNNKHQQLQQIGFENLYQIQNQALLDQFSKLKEKRQEFYSSNDEIELTKIEQIFDILEQEENFVDYYLMGANIPIQNEQQLSETHLFKQFLQYLQKSIKHLMPNEPLKIVFDIDKSLSESDFKQYKTYFVFKILDGFAAALFFDNQKQELSQISSPQHRQHLKIISEPLKNYTKNYTFNQCLIKQDIDIHTKIYEILFLNINELQIFSIANKLEIKEILEVTNKFMIYEQSLKKFDCFQYLDFINFI